MAEFKAGDRVVKMRGMCAGKYGTVNSVAENGTLNVTFDGERLPRYCDPEKCGAVATNAKFKVGDVVYAEPGKIEGVGGKGVIYDKGRYDDYHVNIDGRSFLLPEWVLRSVNSRAANAVKPVGVYRGCKIAVADHSPDDVTRPGKTFIVEDADGVSVGGFVTSDAAKRWCDQHPSRCANSRAANAVRNVVARNAGALPSDAIRSESDLVRAFAKKGWKLIMEGNRWTLRDDKGTIRWQDSFGGGAESYDRVFRRFASYLNLR